MSERAVIVADPHHPTIVITRWFDAPRHLVWEATTRPELVRRWWGPKGTTLSVCDIDLRVGGGWRFVLRGPDGSEVGFRGTYQELSPPDRIVDTFVYEPIPQAEAQQIAVLEEIGGRTKLTVTLIHKNMQSRDGQLQAGMEGGMNETHARLDELLAELVRTSRAAGAAAKAADRRPT